MILGDLSRQELAARLRGVGLTLRTGPFRNRLTSTLPHVVDALAALYADFPVVPSDEFSDFQLNLVDAGGLRRWLMPRTYLLLRGQQIPAYGWFPPHLSMAFLEWGLNYAIYGQINTRLILHSAVLERDGRALLILGNSGAGKSTLCAGLAVSGWRLLSDELGLLGLEDGLLDPVVRPISLKNESIEIIRRLAPEATIGSVCHTKRKGAIAHVRPPTESVRQMDRRAVPRWLILVRYSAGASLSIEEVPRAQCLSELMLSSFNSPNLGASGFEALCRMLEQVVCMRLTYSDLQEAISYFNSPTYGRES